ARCNEAISAVKALLPLWSSPTRLYRVGRVPHPWALMAVPVVTRQQRVPASAATWLALILLLPVAGTLLYILAGYRRNVPAADCPACRGDRLEQIIAHGCGTRPTRYNRDGSKKNFPISDLLLQI
ncbi:PLD nuclease N-terminal domain-containing protein, partial [Alistipes onderdonkii]|uniref:PLD nuclease N-terminal domain-containing protein n=1 Tax=Alistipes onderdonkii TaxID=328813 RepID=UPI00210A9F5F